MPIDREIAQPSLFELMPATPKPVRQRPVAYIRRRALQSFQPLPDPFPLHYYQEEAKEAFLDHHRQGKKKTVIELPPGAGKTAGTAVSIRDLIWLYNGEGCALVLVPWLHLVQQTYDEFLKFFRPEDLGIIQAEKNDLGCRITIASIATLSDRERLRQYLESLSEPLLGIFCDEAHRSICASVLRIHEVLDPQEKAHWQGNTGTPYRSDRRSLETLYSDGLIYSEDFRTLILRGMLADIVPYDVETNLVITPEQIKLARKLSEQSDSGIWTRSGDEITKMLLATNRYEQAFNDWMLHTGGKMKTLIFAQSIPDAYKFKKYFTSRGATIEVIKSGMSQKTRDDIFKAFEIGGPLQIIVNYNVLGTGANFRQCQCIIMGCIKGLGPWTQAVCRGDRICPEIDKTEYILLNLTDQHHTLMSMGALLGRNIPPGTSVKRCMEALLEQEAKAPDAPALPPGLNEHERIAEILSHARSRAYDVFAGDGWTIDNVTGEASKDYGKFGKVYNLPVIPGMYRVLYTSPGGQNRWVTNEPMNARESMIRGHQHVERLRQADHFRYESAKPKQEQSTEARQRFAEPMSEDHWAYLRTRGAGNIGTKGETYKQVMARLKLTEEHYSQADSLLREHKKAWIPETRQRMVFDERRNMMRMKQGQ